MYLSQKFKNLSISLLNFEPKRSELRTLEFLLTPNESLVAVTEASTSTSMGLLCLTTNRVIFSGHNYSLKPRARYWNLDDIKSLKAEKHPHFESTFLTIEDRHKAVFTLGEGGDSFIELLKEKIQVEV